MELMKEKRPIWDETVKEIAGDENKRRTPRRPSTLGLIRFKLYQIVPWTLSPLQRTMDLIVKKYFSGPDCQTMINSGGKHVKNPENNDMLNQSREMETLCAKQRWKDVINSYE
ncbi:hypothetical protein TorRG33x02_342600 [Trema orientale]|uniref:Uncharacterized protein n=1 Tax=Trema orientale TaxID=63057 RepID=A0A2P5ASK7_TREOI|nr:hypothetical protein TorRG33x02_342600 [Trema orientale]